jgi:predicted MFS family arabinose efflux permease
VLASFVAMAVWQDSLVMIAVGAVVFDMGIQAASVSHQTIVYSLDPAARSRLNAVLISSIFIGMSIGAAVGSQAFAHWGWTGVTLTGAAAGVVALCVHFARFAAALDELPRPQQNRTPDRA